MQKFIPSFLSAAKKLLALALVLFPMAELRATTFTVNTTADTHAKTPGSSPQDSATHISLRSAIEAANAETGSFTISVPAGTYELTLGELQVSTATGASVIDISGVGAATTVVMQTDGTNRVFNIDPNSTGGSAVTLSGLTIEGGTDKADNFGGAGILDGSITASPVDVLTLQNCIIQNNHCQAMSSSGNPGGGVSMEGGNLTITSCTFSDNSSGSSQGAGVYFFPQNVASTLTVSGSAFTGNSISDTTGAGIGGSAIFIGSTSTSPSVAHSITDSMFMNNSVVGNESTGSTFGAIQIADSSSGNSVSISGCNFVDNSVTSQPDTTGLGGALAVNSGHVSVNFCRFFGNVADRGSAIFSSVVNSASINATDNWWSCNGGPDTAGCQSITGDGTGGSFGSTINFAPYIVLSFTPNPNPINTGGSTTLTAGFLQDSANNILTAANVAVLDALPIAIDTPVLGSLSGQQAVIQASGTATTSFLAGITAGTGHANATVDNATVTANITINAPTATLTITGSPSDASLCNGETATFTASATGTPPPALQWQVSVAGGPFANVTGATTSPLSFTATTADNGNQYRAVFNNGTTLATSAATLTVFAPPVAVASTLGTTENVAVNAPVAKLLALDSSPIGGALSITDVSGSSAMGGKVVLSGQFISYTPPSGFFGADSFTYTLSDTRCTAQGTVNVTITPANAPSLNTISIALAGATRVVTFAGIPGITYVVQWADAAGDPWADFSDGAIAAGPTGLITYTDSTSPVPPVRIYRTRVAN
jgi:hypothetical protein